MNHFADKASAHDPPAPTKDNVEEGLTGIPACIHLAATNEGGDQADERDEIVVDAFLDTLARIALAVASRISTTGEEMNR